VDITSINKVTPKTLDEDCPFVNVKKDYLTIYETLKWFLVSLGLTFGNTQSPLTKGSHQNTLIIGPLGTIFIFAINNEVIHCMF